MRIARDSQIANVTVGSGEADLDVRVRQENVEMRCFSTARSAPKLAANLAQLIQSSTDLVRQSVRNPLILFSPVR